MRSIHLCLTFAFVLTIQSGAAKDRGIIRATAAIANCAAQGADAWTTARTVAMGNREGNPILATASGAPRWSLIIPMKAALCGIGVWRAQRNTRYSTPLNFVVAGAVGAIAVHNYTLAKPQ